MSSTQTVPLTCWQRPPLRSNDRRSWQAQARAFKVALDEARWCIRAAKPTPVVGANVTLHYRPHSKRRQDPDGFAPTLKACLDALVQTEIAGRTVLPDDCWPHVEVAACQLHAPGEPAALWLTLDTLTDWDAA